MDKFEQANQKVHRVEDQWHYKILIKYGFTPVTKEAVGFVRKYEYTHPNGATISCHTGASCDYIMSNGNWGDLEAWAKKVTSPA